MRAGNEIVAGVPAGEALHQHIGHMDDGGLEFRVLRRRRRVMMENGLSQAGREMPGGGEPASHIGMGDIE